MDKISSIFLLILSILILIGSIPLKLGTSVNPGPGFFPFVAGSILGILSLVSLIERILFPSKKEKKSIWPPRDGVNRLILTSLGLIVYVLLLERVGFILITFCLLTFLFWKVGYQRWYISLGEGLAFTLFFYILFSVLLQVPFTKGWLGI